MWQKIKNIYHLFVAISANIYYGFPAKKLTVIGITGTDGKTTTASLVYHILQTAGYPVSMITTVEARIHGKSKDTGFHVTTPSSFKLQKLLSEIKKEGDGIKYVVLEVTSHAIDQHRIWGVPFAMAVLTNVTHEHLDYHGSYEEYVKTKTKLLNKAQVAVVNIDDQSYPIVKKYLTQNNPYTYSIKNKARITQKDISIPNHFLGKYNIYNSLAAASVANDLGIDFSTVNKALKTFVFPIGRTEVVYSKDFTIMVDFAHTPNALEQILSTLKPMVKGRLIHVFGAAGERDASKRPLMGKVAASYDDVIILTAEDPRGEKVEKINAQIMSKMLKGKKYLFEIDDRLEAIKYAVSLAKKDDYIIITGKGHEGSMNYDGKNEIPWSDIEAVRKAIHE